MRHSSSKRKVPYVLQTWEQRNDVVFNENDQPPDCNVSYYKIDLIVLKLTSFSSVCECDAVVLTQDVVQ